MHNKFFKYLDSFQATQVFECSIFSINIDKTSNALSKSLKIENETQRKLYLKHLKNIRVYISTFFLSILKFLVLPTAIGFLTVK